MAFVRLLLGLVVVEAWGISADVGRAALQGRRPLLMVALYLLEVEGLRIRYQE